MRKILIATAALVFGLGLAAVNPALSHQLQCGKTTEVRSKLSMKYGETSTSVGVTADGGLAEVLISKDGGTWTILVSYPNGNSCMIANGEGWRRLNDLNFDPKV